MMAAVDAGVPKLVHTPHFGWLSFEDAKRVAAAGVKQLSTIGYGVPVFGVFANDNKPRFRDGKAWPESILDGDGRGQEAGYKAVNARTSWDAGVIYGYSTDTGYEPRAGLEHELKTLNLMFSMQDIIKLMGPNAASYIEMSNDLGTLEKGKLADIVLLGGNPLEGYWNMLNAKVVIKGGVIMVDKRTPEGFSSSFICHHAEDQQHRLCRLAEAPGTRPCRGTSWNRSFDNGSRFRPCQPIPSIVETIPVPGIPSAACPARYTACSRASRGRQRCGTY